MPDESAAERYFRSVESELNQERAAVLGRYGRRVEDAIATCGAMLDALDVTDPASVDTYTSARKAALRAVADLCLQREMIGLHDHAWVHRIYRVPPPPSGDRHRAPRRPG